MKGEFKIHDVDYSNTRDECLSEQDISSVGGPGALHLELNRPYVLPSQSCPQRHVNVNVTCQSQLVT